MINSLTSLVERTYVLSLPKFLDSRLSLPLSIFLFVTLVVGIPRMGMLYLSNDPECIRYMENTMPSHSTDPWGLFLRSITASWYDGGSPGGDYRPLNSIICIGMFLLRDHPLIPIFTSSALLGIAAALVYLLVMEITQKRIIALSSAFIFSLAIPSISMTWIVINKQPLVPLIITFGLLCYVRYQKYNRTSWLYLLWATCFIGPLFRELTGILPLTVMSITLAERRWDKRLLISLPLFLFHGVFPSFLPNLLFYGHIALYPIFGRGYMAVNEMSFVSSPLYLKERMPPHFVLLLPPVLTILGVYSALLFLTARISSKRLRVVSSIIALIFVATFVFNKVSYFLVVVLVTLASFHFGKFLPIWFLVSWLPFLKLYSREVHLVTALIPWTVMILLWVEYLFGYLKEFKEAFAVRPVRLLVSGVVILAFLDHSLNLIATYSAFSEISNGYVKMANYFERNAKAGSVVVSNYSSSLFLDALGSEKVVNYWAPGTAPTGWPCTKEILEASELEAMLEKGHAGQEFYLLEHVGRRLFHPYVENPPCGRPEFVTRFVTNSGYPFLDPFKHFLTGRYITFPGPPDLFGEFLRTTTSLFYRKNLAVYDLYRLSYPTEADSNRPHEPSLPPPLIVEEGYRGRFDIFLFGRKYYGLAQGEGGFDISRITKKDYKLCFVGSSANEVKRLIDKHR